MERKNDKSEGLLLAIFKLGDASFGVDARVVQEVVKEGEITRVHQAPEHVLGVRNLRGRIVTVVDMASRLEIGSVRNGSLTRLLIMEWQGETLGFLVDEVTEAMMIAEDHIAMPPASIDHSLRRYLRGVRRDGGHLIAILEPNSLFQWEETSDIAKIS